MSPKKILIVEDERLVAEDISECLLAGGYEVCGIANEGQKAINLALEHRPDLVLMDIVIQGDLDGIETATAIKKEIGIAVLFLTAYSQEGIVERAKAVDPLGFIVKPFEESGLLSTVKIALHKSLVDKQLKASSDWFSTTLSSIGDGVIATDLDGQVRFMNNLAEKLTGWSFSEAEGQLLNGVITFIDEDSGQTVSNPALVAMETGEVQTLDEGSLLVPKSGPPIPIGDSGAPIHDASGKCIGSVLVFRDITDKRFAAKETEQYQKELEQLVEKRTQALKRRVELERLTNSIASTLLASEQVDLNGHLFEGLKQIAEFLNLDSAGVLASGKNNDANFRPMAMYVRNPEDQAKAEGTHPGKAHFLWFTDQLKEFSRIVINRLDDIPKDAVHERAYLEMAGSQSLVVLPLLEDNSRIVSFAMNQERKWSEDEIVGLISVAGVFGNAIKRSEMEAEQGSLQEQLIQAQKLEAIGKLTGGIAHDFNNMLVPIIGYADSILASGEHGEWINEVKEIRKAADSAASLTRQLLAFSKKQILDKTDLSLHEQIHLMEKILQRLLGEDIELVVEADAKNDIVEADKGQLQQILVNLCVNSRDAMPEGGLLKLSTKNVPGGNTVVLTVSDTGCGMKRKDIEKAFDPFFTTKGEDGTGLGLSVVMGIVEQHNGTMKMESELNLGTLVHISLPAVAAATAPTATIKKQVRSKKISGNGEKILLVEDEPAVMNFVSTALKRRNYDITTAENLAEAKAVFDENSGEFDMILTDAKLPDGTGLDVLRYIHSKDPSMRALLSSGYTDERALVDQAKKRGVRFLQKPYALAQLYEEVNFVLHPLDNGGSEELNEDLLSLPS